MKFAHAWTEEVTFVECPRCGALLELGSDIVFSAEPTNETCLCGETYRIVAPDQQMPADPWGPDVN